MMRRLFEMRRWVMWVLVALVCLQTLSVIHRTVHKESVAQRTSQTLSNPTVLHETSSTSFSNVSTVTQLIAGLWDQHKSVTDCQLFDQACPEAVQPALHLDIFTPAFAMWLSIMLLERFALFERFYAVRGPPLPTLT